MFLIWFTVTRFNKWLADSEPFSDWSNLKPTPNMANMANMAHGQRYAPQHAPHLGCRPGPAPERLWHRGRLEVHRPMPRSSMRCKRSSMAKPGPKRSEKRKDLKSQSSLAFVWRIIVETTSKKKDAVSVEPGKDFPIAAGLLSCSKAARLGPDTRSSVPPIHQEDSTLSVLSALSALCSVTSVKSVVSQLHSTGRRQPAVFAESPAACATCATSRHSLHRQSATRAFHQFYNIS